MELRQAELIAQRVKDTLAPYCSKIEIAGSIRRRKEFVHDVDIVCIPSNQGGFLVALRDSGWQEIKAGPKIMTYSVGATNVDIYIATPETWATFLLIRTGSKEHNIRLCSLALSKGMKLHADGSGLFKDGKPILCDSEESIFQALELPYRQPWERN